MSPRALKTRMYVLRWGNLRARISLRVAEPTIWLCSSTTVTISSAAVVIWKQYITTETTEDTEISFLCVLRGLRGYSNKHLKFHFKSVLLLLHESQRRDLCVD